MSMGDNPYAPPKTDIRAVGVLSGKREDVLAVAKAQRAILICILVYFVALIAQFALPANLRIIVALSVLGVGIVATVFVFMLATRVYGTGLGIVFAILTFVPCVGLLMLLVINSKATNILRANGYTVGFLGAKIP
jgi:hypothetical protein